MDTIEFRLTYFEYGADNYSSSAVDIFINGEDLLPRIHDFEDSVGCGGGHAPIWIGELYKSLSEDYKTDSVAIYGCGCGVTDCSAIYITVEVGEKTVTWKNFILPDENLRGEIIYPRRFGEFVFDKEQYFREIHKLKQWRFNDKLSVEYGGIEEGGLKLVVKNINAFNFYFDELLDDPLPDLVKFFNAVRGGENYFDVEIMRDDGHVALKLSIKRWGDEQIRFYVELVGEEIIFCEYMKREDLIAMLKKIFDDLLNDKYFLYSYPCFWYLSETDEKNFDAVTDAIEAEHPDWTTGDVWNYAVEAKGIKLAPRYEKYLAHYKKMLTKYIIPDKWFD